MNKQIVIIVLALVSSIFFSCEKEVFTGYPEVPVSQLGRLIIQSNPSNAAIYVDGKNSGFKTPADFNWISVGGHQITLKKELYKDAVFGIYISKNFPYTINFDFTNDPKNFGNIYCSSQVPACDIYMNDTLTGKKTNYTFTKITPGIYKVKFTHAEHWPDSTTVTLSASETAQVQMDLIDTSKIVQYTSSNSPLPTMIISTITVDKSNQVWLGSTMGVTKIAGRTWITYNKKNSPLNTDYITNIVVDKQNNKWIGTSKGIYKFDGNVWVNYAGEFNNSYVNAIAIDSTDGIWVGTDIGLFYYSNNNWKLYNTSTSGIPENLVTCLTVDKTNKIWIGSAYHGLTVYDGKVWTVYNKDNIGLTVSNQVMAVNSDFAGNILAAFVDSYLISFDGTNWIDKSSYYNVPFTQMIYKNSSSLIIGSKHYGAKIFRADGTSTSINRMINGTYINWVQCAAIDHDNNLWLSNFTSGLYKFKKGSY